jgi:hypothetical protein
MKKPSTIRNEHLEHLFEMELQFRQELTSRPSPIDGIGEYVGSGDGIINGPRIHATVCWDLWEQQGETLCRSSLTGVIETHDEAKIQFDSRGFFIKPDQSNPNRWITTASVHFNTAEHHYEWLNRILAVWVGEFDMETYRHRYQAYAQIAN